MIFNTAKIDDLRDRPKSESVEIKIKVPKSIVEKIIWDIIICQMPGHR